MRRARAIGRAAIAVVLFAGTASRMAAQWTPMQSGTSASLRGLSVVDSRVVWASGTRGTVVHTVDGGKSWRVDTVPGATGFDLRSVHARSARVAHTAGTAGRIWRTTDGGLSWSLRYQATDTSVFLDAIDFWDDRHGMAIGDPIGGRFFVLVTDDAGESWHEAPVESRPGAVEGEGAFAASGSSLILAKDGAWLGSGGPAARLYVSRDGGRRWSGYPTPIMQGTASQGIFSVAFVPGVRGGLIAVGGDYQHPDSVRAIAFFWRANTAVGWTLSTVPPRGFRSGVAIAARAGTGSLSIAVGPTGSDMSRDFGATWTPFDSIGFHAVRVSRDGIFFASGSDGRLAFFDSRTLK